MSLREVSVKSSWIIIVLALLAHYSPGGKTYSWRGFPSTSMRRGPWKLIEFHEDNSVGLYNLKVDPSESNNLADSMPDRVT